MVLPNQPDTGLLPALGQTVREVAAELTVALGGVMPGVKTA